ncbi:type ISP restriction/modification enzyme [Thioalkalivibrio sp. HK1]|uniref:type ISP restriction/modification enzyme n=1 Tax=Thioalkalivibrio sp. HK1 TaxID=1469245 RepID=UPI0004B6CFE3|nr:type ISP restriction/modification enzyme [Thioalkalivibrio sp. HK1]
MAQTVREWNNDTGLPMRSFAVCSDSQVGTRRKYADKNDIAEISTTDLEIPATTDPEKLGHAMANAQTRSVDGLSVVFATYQSIQVIAEAQKKHNAPHFDLIVCDEAHRTTGATLSGAEESNFVKVHDNDIIAGNKRLYMTATPRIFSDTVVARAREVEASLASMNDESLFGPVFHYLSFGKAVEQRLLSDYKVVVLKIDEGTISAGVQSALADESNELKLDDATKIIGCYKALAKQGLKKDLRADPGPMRRALAFCRSIKSSKLIKDEFVRVVEEYIEQERGREEREQSLLPCEVEHIDGTFRAKERGRLLDWLRDGSQDGGCRILSNARVLSEGVDVPALDAILFLHPRKSQIDVVQAVGRVMRRAEGKKLGYVVLPVGIPAGVPPEQALKDNERFKVIWQILNALRAHDDRLDAVINQGGLGQDITDRIEIVTVVDHLPSARKTPSDSIDIGGRGSQEPAEYSDEPTDESDRQYTLGLDEAFSRAVLAMLVDKCGNRTYWADWAKDVAEIAQRHISRLQGILKRNIEARGKFDDFLKELKAEINDSIQENDAIEMLAQHIVTRPVFEALFKGGASIDRNPVSRAMQKILDQLESEHLEKESASLDGFYESVRRRTEGLTDPKARQKLAAELYESFFRNAFPLTAQKLGVAYTPVEIVDFIIHSIDGLLEQEFGENLSSENINILEPFVGTGTFIARLLQSGLIKPEDLERKYENEIFANEIQLLPYYISLINIESAYQAVSGARDYKSFKGLNLTDTFEAKKPDLLRRYFEETHQRRERMEKRRIDVILGNPPYSVGQRSQNDNAQNVSYPELNDRIQETYIQGSLATNHTSLRDRYICAIRWATDRIPNRGIIGFVINASWIESISADRMRACLQEEFSSLYLFDLKGNARLSGDAWRKSGGKIFGASARVPAVIALLVKNPDEERPGKILYCDVGDYLSQKEKLERISIFHSAVLMQKQDKWTIIQPNQNHDWVNQRRSDFHKYIHIGNKKQKESEKIFDLYSAGLKTNRDAWCVNHSKNKLIHNINRTLSFYNEEVDRYLLSKSKISAADFVNRDSTKISWNFSDFYEVERGKYLDFNEKSITHMVYRPYNKQWCYYNRNFNNSVHLLSKLFSVNDSENNFLIATAGPGAPTFSTLMIGELPDFSIIATGQYFPLKGYPINLPHTGGLLNGKYSEESHWRYAISDQGLAHFQRKYPNQAISKEDIFYYTYAVLHSEQYRETYSTNLTKELPRIPLAPNDRAFREFVDAGRQLGHLHVNYEEVEPYKIDLIETRELLSVSDQRYYRVEKMKFAGSARQPDKSKIVYNASITLAGIPLEAYGYKVNGKSAIDWVMDRQCVRIDKDSGIVNDANDYANETMNDPRYPLDLLRRVITVSLDTLAIVRILPELDLG